MAKNVRPPTATEAVGGERLSAARNMRSGLSKEKLERSAVTNVHALQNTTFYVWQRHNSATERKWQDGESAYRLDHPGSGLGPGAGG